MDSSSEASFSPTEWQVMSAVWELGEADVFKITDLVRSRFGRAYTQKTMGVLLFRLERKGHLRSTVADPAGRGRPVHLYSPVVSRQAAITVQLQRFLRDFFLDNDEDLIMLRALLSQRVEQAPEDSST